MGITSVLLVDLFPGAGGSITASVSETVFTICSQKLNSHFLLLVQFDPVLAWSCGDICHRPHDQRNGGRMGFHTIQWHDHTSRSHADYPSQERPVMEKS
jgi:hypothetical protein